MDDRFIYQKKDFVNIGVPEGSFSRVIKNLDLETPEYMTIKQLPNKINAKFFTQEAMEVVLDYLKDKQAAKNKNELMLLEQNTELKQQVQQLQNVVALLESRHTQEMANAKDEWHEKEKDLISQAESQRRATEKAEQELEHLETMSWWQFRAWKKRKKQGK